MEILTEAKAQNSNYYNVGDLISKLEYNFLSSKYDAFYEYVNHSFSLYA